MFISSIEKLMDLYRFLCNALSHFTHSDVVHHSLIVSIFLCSYVISIVITAPSLLCQLMYSLYTFYHCLPYWIYDLFIICYAEHFYTKISLSILSYLI